MRKSSRAFQPHSCFLILAIIFGVILVFCTAPFQVPDEPNHFFRVYQLSQFDLRATRSADNVGGNLPQSLTLLADIFEEISYNPQRKVSRQDFSTALAIKLDGNTTTFTEFPNTALYSPVPYASTALGILIGKIVNAPPLVMMYMGRIANLAVWITLIYFAIRTVPFFKWVFVLLALAPMSIFQAASLSADSFTNAIAFFFITYTLRLAYDPAIETIQTNQKAILTGSAVLLMLAKQAYLPLLAIITLIPPARFSGLKNRWGFVLAAIGAALACQMVWSALTADLYIPLNGADPRSQLNSFFANPLGFIILITKSIYYQLEMVYVTTLGRYLGWFNVCLPKNIIKVYWIVIILTALQDCNQSISVRIKEKLLMFVIVTINFYQIYAMLLLSWTKPGLPLVDGIQGRYFIPDIPLLSLLFYNTRFAMRRHYAYFIIFITTIMLSYTIFVIAQRFYL